MALICGVMTAYAHTDAQRPRAPAVINAAPRNSAQNSHGGCGSFSSSAYSVLEAANTTILQESTIDTIEQQF
jgi:hypothetical protein